MDLRHLVFRLLFSLAAGTFLSFGLVKRAEVGPRYYLYHGLGVVAVAALAYAFGSPAPAPGVRIAFFAFLFFATLYSFLPHWLVFLPTAGMAVTALLLELGGGGWMQANALLSALMLGMSLAAMLLGHWYLVQPKLSIAELARVTLVFFAVILIRFLFGTYSIYQLLAGRSETEIYRYLLSGNPGLFILMRWSWGLLAPLVLSYFIWGTVKIRSTQSATGILYVAVLCVLTGETLSQYLALFPGIPC